MKNIRLRFAEENDCKDLFKWRNDPISIKFSRAGKINYVEHKKWFHKKIRDPKTQIFIITNQESKKIGVVRFDTKKETTIVNININPKFRGKGLSHPSLIKAIKQYFNDPNAKYLLATIKEDNIPSLKIFKKAGFKQTTKKKDILTFKLTKNEFNKIRR